MSCYWWTSIFFFLFALSFPYKTLSIISVPIILIVLATMVMVFGKLLFGFVLGNVASVMANDEMLRVLFEERFTSIQTHMKEQRMSLDIQHRVFNFFQYIWRRNKWVIQYTNLGFGWLPSFKKKRLLSSLYTNSGFANHFSKEVLWI